MYFIKEKYKHKGKISKEDWEEGLKPERWLWGVPMPVIVCATVATTTGRKHPPIQGDLTMSMRKKIFTLEEK